MMLGVLRLEERVVVWLAERVWEWGWMVLVDVVLVEAEDGDLKVVRDRLVVVVEAMLMVVIMK